MSPRSSRLPLPELLTGLVALVTVPACGEDPPASPGQQPGRSGVSARFLIQELDRARVETFLEKPARRVEYALADLETVGTFPDGKTRVLRLPLPFERDAAGNPVQAVLRDAAGKPLGAAEGTPPLRMVSARREILAAEHPAFEKGWPKHRTPVGEQWVWIRKPCAMTTSIPRVGTPTLLRIKASLQQSGRTAMAPALQLTCGGRPVGEVLWTARPVAPPVFVLPEALGNEELTLAIRNVSAGEEAPRFELYSLVLEEADLRDRALVRGEPGAEPRSLAYVAAVPEGTRQLAPSPGDPRSLKEATHLAAGEAALVASAPFSGEVFLDGVRVAQETGAREIAFPVTHAAMAELEVRSAEPLPALLWLVQPAASYQHDLPFLRESDPDAVLVRPTVWEETIRESLLLPRGSEAAFPLEIAGGARLSFACGHDLAAPTGVALQPPELGVLWREGGATTPLRRVSFSAAAAWTSVSLELPPGARGELVFQVPASAEFPVASRHQVVAVAHPRVLAPASLRAPNVLVYLIDTLRADHLSSYGYARPTSPHLDALAQDGVLFEHAYSQAPWTRPSVASLFTGLLYSFHGAGKTSGLALSFDTLAEVLHAAGFDTAAFVANAQIHGQGLHFLQGFQTFVAVEDVVGASRATDVNAHLLPWLEQQQSEPFFCYVHTIDPHSRYDPPPETAGTFNQGYSGKLGYEDLRGQRTLKDALPLQPADLQYLLDLYDEEILANDRAFGEIVAKLRALGRYDDTLIVVLADHGEEFLEHGDFGHGMRLFEELLHVPLIVKLPGKDAPRGVRVRERVRVMDLYPTLLRAAGVAPPAGRFQGVDLAPLWGPDAGSWEPLPVLAEEEPALRSLLLGDWKLIQSDYHRPDKEQRQLFELRSDPGEQHGVSDAERADALLARLLALLQGYRDAGFEPPQDLLPLDLSPEEREALRALGYLY